MWMERLAAPAQGVKQRAAGCAMEPARVTHEPAVVGHDGFFFRAQDAEEVIGLREGELGVAERGHGRERGRFFAGERADGFVAIEKRVEMVEMDSRGLFWVLDECQPLHDVALDGVGQVVDGVGAVGEAEVDDGGGAARRGRIAPEKIGGVKIVVGPERGERGQERRKLGVKWSEEIEGLMRRRRERLCDEQAMGGRRGNAPSAAAGILRCEDGEAGDERARLARRRSEILRG